MPMAPHITRLLLFLFLFGLSHAALVEYNWNITWTTTNPDNAFERPTMGINGQWPLPIVEVNRGDQVLVHVNNQLGNESTSIHFHGLYQNGTAEMDGVVGTTQCAIPPDSSFTYNFTANQIGTYWYHSHVRGQYPDGLRGMMLIHDPQNPFIGQFDEEVSLTLSDWYHDSIPNLLKSFISVTNPTGAEPVPDAALMNDTQNATFSVQPGKTYLFHIVNMGAFAGQYFWFEGHQMQVVEVDGVWTEPAAADMLYITVAQRYSVLVTTSNDTSSNFPIVGSMDEDLFDTVPPTLNPNATSWLVYDPAKPLPPPAELDAFNPFDDFTLIPMDKQSLFTTVDQTVSLDMKMDNLGDGANYAFFNDITYVAPKVPTLYTVLTSGSLATNDAIYGVNTNAFILGHQQIVEIILNNLDTNKHPFHLHGHNFQVVARSDENQGNFANNVTFPATPMRRDTLLVNPQGNFVIRFRSDNPGVWLFHCHIEWHISSGLVATIIEAPLELQSLQPPADHYASCRAGGDPTAGNAAGNTQNLLDLTGANVSPPPLPDGFTPRGIVAMTFSIVSALLGMFVIGWYGSRPITTRDVVEARKRVEQVVAR